MEIFFELYNYISNTEGLLYKVVGGIITIILTIILILIKSKFFQDFITKIFFSIGGNIITKLFTKKNNNEEIGSIQESDIINHDIFNYIEFWLYNQIPSLTLRTQYRTAVFRKYLHIYIKTYKENLLDFIREDSYKTMDGSELRKNLLLIITNTTIIMETEMRTIGIPDVIIIKMKNVLNDRINLTIDLINSICDSAFYDGDDNLLKIYSFLNIVHSILDNTISNVETVCNNLNGELSGLSMDGYTEPMSKGNH